MSSPATRLLTVLELLQAHGPLSGTELARRLEVDVRTVRRYIMRLQDLGLPIEAARGPYGAYRLGRGYKLPPLLFSDPEAVALTLGLLAIRQWRFPVEVAAIEGALAKTARVLPERLLAQARALEEAICFNLAPSTAELPSRHLLLLSTAVHTRTAVQLRYQNWAGAESEREFDPYGIVFHEGYWYTCGHCHLRGALRTLRLDRIGALEALARPFERPADFDALTHVLQAVGGLAGVAQIEVVLHTTLEEARAATARALGTLEETAEGIVYRRAATQLEWIAPMLLNLPFAMEVRGPDELRRLIRRLGQRAQAILGEDAPGPSARAAGAAEG